NIEEYYWAKSQFEDISSTRSIIKFFVPINKKKEIRQDLFDNFKDKITIESIDISKKRPTQEAKEFKGNLKRKKSKEELENKKESAEKERTLEDNGNEKDLRGATPTIMKNFFLFRPFETLTRLYGTPSYSEVDPTPFLFFTFPLLFGLMFGDIGHGLCLVIAGLIGAIVFRKRKGRDLHNMCWIIFYCGWGAIIGGFLYGEFFGMHEIAILGLKLEPVVIPFLNISLHNPLDNIMTVFLFAVLVGVFHINLGWFIQFLNYWKQKHKYFAVTDSLCKMALLDGGALLLFIWGFNIDTWFAFPYPILLPLIPGLLLVLFKPLGKVFRVSYLKKESFGSLIGEGSMETFETVLSVMSNVASYVRLLALALAHIALMLSIQAMIGLIQGEGIFIQILIVIGLIIGNLIVILLEGLLVFLNTIRLHFYEFFFKFYQGSGTEFFPFYLDTVYSQIVFKVDTEKDVITEEIEKEISVKTAQENIERAKNYISKKYFK
ncbi:MAG: V-type ATPase 116kDa subunit family protein, partial [Promethearchaeota archaeon]